MDSVSGIKNGPYQLFMLGLCFFVLGLLAVDALVTLEPEARQVLIYGDLGICVLFFMDFLVSFYRAPNRLEYFVKWGWIDLVSSIPMLDYVRWGRAARIFRIFHVLRGVRAAKVLAEFVLSKRAESAFLAATLICILVLVLSSIAILQFERSPASNIKSAEDAIWWTFVTMTTVGYGDKFPVTTEGRIVAVGVMVMGVGLFGTFTGFIASWFLSGEDGQDSELKSIKRELEEIKLALREKAAGIEEERGDQLKGKERSP